MTTRLSFLGGVGTVTGSKYLLEAEGQRYLIDCGLFQGYKQLRLRNWAPLPFDPCRLDRVLLTHAHLDHSGALPLLFRGGFDGTVHATPATRDLCAILLPDSGYLQEQEAAFANRHGFSKHHPAKPLYTREEAEACMRCFRPTDFGEPLHLASGAEATFFPAGHILGAAMIQFRIGSTRILFSGDLGRLESPTMVDPAIVSDADYLIIESTYGDRHHDSANPEDLIAEIVNRVAARGGTVLIPAFAVGRAQTILFHLARLKSDARIPDLPIVLDSPMAITASDVFCDHVGAHRLTAAQCQAMCDVVDYVRDVEESKALDRNPMPKIIISASGMATGGRILHHLKSYAPDRRNAILFSGYQAGGTRGAAMVKGAETVKIHGTHVPVRAEVNNLDMLSAHADAREILTWLGNFERQPKQTFITHGEAASSDALRVAIQEELGWPCTVPEYRDQVDLS